MIVSHRVFLPNNDKNKTLCIYFNKLQLWLYRLNSYTSLFQLEER